MAWTALTNDISIEIIILYVAAIFWTLGYDTIYGTQDISDDEIIGLKSTAIKFKNNPYTFLYLCYSIFIISLIIVGYLMELNNIYYLFLIIAFFQMFYFQLKKLNIKSELNCLRVFKSNNFLGLLIYTSLILGKVY